MKRVNFQSLGPARARLAVLCALLAVCVYRGFFYVPSPGVNREYLARHIAASFGETVDPAAESSGKYKSDEPGRGNEDAAR